jgi:hypothetical protein
MSGFGWEEAEIGKKKGINKMIRLTLKDWGWRDVAATVKMGGKPGVKTENPLLDGGSASSSLPIIGFVRHFPVAFGCGGK